MSRFCWIFPLLLSIVLNVSCSRHCSSPPRPENIPHGAVWVGGCDGGYWIESVDKKSRFRIYHESSGELEFDAEYRLVDCDQDIHIKLSKIVAVNIDQIIIGMDRKRNCTMTPQLPAFGGSQWQIMQGKNTDIQ